MPKLRQNFRRNLAHEERGGEQDNADVVQCPDDRDVLRDIQRADSEDERSDENSLRRDGNARVGEEQAVQGKLLGSVLRELPRRLPAADPAGHLHEAPQLFPKVHALSMPISGEH